MSKATRIAVLAGTVVVGAGIVGGVMYGTGSSGETVSENYTPLNKTVQLVGRDVMRAIVAWREGAGLGPVIVDESEDAPPPPEPAPVDLGSGPLELAVDLRQRDASDLPDDVVIVACPDLAAWVAMMDAQGYVPLVAARSPSTLGAGVTLYDGREVRMVTGADIPTWASGPGGLGPWTKADLAGGQKRVTLTRPDSKEPR
jgi:hypothetical protein